MQKFVTLALLTAKALAQNETSDEIEERKFSHIVKMAYSQITTTHQLKTISKMIQNYGCHCFPGLSRAAGGSGPAMDDYDRLCKKLYRCHKCIEFDHDGLIDVNEGKYRWSQNVDGSINCNANPDQHKKDLCLCDADYAMELASVWDDSTFNYALWNNKKNKLYNFDAQNTCVAAAYNGDMQCCGDYPNRYPYNADTRNCCLSTKTYDPNFEDCCNDGSTASTGSC